MNFFELLKPFSAGILTVVSPCILPLLPIYLAILTRSAATRLQAFFGTLFFTAGFSLVFVILGLGATSIGMALNEHRALLLAIGGVLICLFGLLYLGFISIPILEKHYSLEHKVNVGSGFFSAFVMGAIFALGWTPCAGPVIGAVLTYTASKAADLQTGALYLAAFSIGVSLPFLVLSLFYDRLKDRIKRLNRFLPAVQKITGVLLIILGVALLRAAWPLAVSIDDFNAPSLINSAGENIIPTLGQPTAEPRLVMFKSPHCPVCRAMQPTLKQLAEDCRGKKIEIIEVDLSKPQNAEAKKLFRVQAFPTLAFLSKSGKEELRLIGKASIVDLRRAASVLIGTECGGEQAAATDFLGYIFSENCSNEVLSCSAEDGIE